MAVTDTIAELESALVDLSPKLEGLRDYTRLNLEPASMAEVQAILSEYVARESAINTALAALEALVVTGYPADITRTVSATVASDLRTNRDTVTAAFGQFVTSPTAVNGSVEFTPVP